MPRVCPPSLCRVYWLSTCTALKLSNPSKLFRLFSVPLPGVLLLTALCCLAFCRPAAAQVTLLVPSQPGIEAPDKVEKESAQSKERPDNAKKALGQKQARPEQAVTPTAPDAAPTPSDGTGGSGGSGGSGKSGESARATQPKGQGAQDAQAAPSSEAVQAGSQAAPPSRNATQAQAAPAAEASPPQEAAINEEVDVLITMMRPFQHQGLAMDMPQLFAVLRYDAATPFKEGAAQPERRDLLGDVEEIRYLDQKAWGANVALAKPGLYQFVIEARPWWDAARDRFLQHYVKTVLPVYGVENGWELPVGQRFEIQPLTRPFGLSAPALFSGVALLHGKPLPGASVRMARINTDKQAAPTSWHEELAARTDNDGEFSFVLDQPGWWCCMAFTAGDPLKGPDGQPKPLELGALFWLYVDGPAAESRKR